MTPVRLHHQWHGPATGPQGEPPLMLAGSLGTTAQAWAPQAAALSTSRPVIAIDLRGHGRSPAPPGPYTLAALGADVLALLDRLDLPRVSYCGLSLGGIVGMWLAARAPLRIHRLALLSTAAHFPPARQWHDRAALVRARGVTAIAPAVLDRWFTPRFHTSAPGTVAHYRAMLTATPVDGYAGCCEALADADVRSVLPAVAAPTLAVAGAEDPATPPDRAREIARLVPGARVASVAGAAHLANVEAPHEVTALLRGHLG